MFCKNCGNQLSEGAKFCAKCGTKVEAAATEAVVEAAVKAPSADKKKKSKKGLWIGLSVLLVLLIAAAGVGVFFYMSPSAKYDRTMEKAQFCMSKDSYADAIDYYKEALEYQKTKEAEKRLLKAYLKLAESQYDEEDYDGAISTYQTILKTEDDNYDALYGITACEYEIAKLKLEKEDYEGALKQYTIVLENTDYNSKFLKETQKGILSCKLGLGNKLVAEGDYEGAYVYFQEIMDSNLVTDELYEDALMSRHKCLIPLGNAAMTSGDMALAEDYYKKAVYEDDTEADGYLGLAQIEANEGNVQSAIEWLDNGLSRISDSAKVKELQDKRAFYYDNVIVLSMKAVNDYTIAEDIYNANGQVISHREENTYGLLLKEELYSDSGLLLHYYSNGEADLYYTYDDMGNLLQMSGNDYEGEVFEKHEYEYDSNGNITKTVDYDENDTVLRIMNSRYTDDSKLLLTEVYYYNSVGEISSRLIDEYSYDEKGNEIYCKTSSKWSEGDGYDYVNERISTNSYDESGHLIKTEITTNESYDGKQTERKGYRNYTYDNSGNLIEIREYNVEYINGGVQTVYSYDNGVLKSEEKNYFRRDSEEYYRHEIVNYYADGTTIAYTEDDFEGVKEWFDEEGRLIKHEDYMESYEYDFDACGNVTRSYWAQFYGDDREIAWSYEFIYENIYNDFGNLAKSICRDNRGGEEITEYEYEYDFNEEIKTLKDKN